jgi:hypothetical protein
LPFVGRIERLTGPFEFGGAVAKGVTPAPAAATQTCSPLGAEESVYVERAIGYVGAKASGTAAALAAAAGAAAVTHASGVATADGAELPPPQPAAASKAHPARTARSAGGDRFTFDTQS